MSARLLDSEAAARNLVKAIDLEEHLSRKGIGNEAPSNCTLVWETVSDSRHEMLPHTLGSLCVAQHHGACAVAPALLQSVAFV